MLVCDYVDESLGTRAVLFPAKFTRLQTFTGSVNLFSNPEAAKSLLFNSLRMLPSSIKTLNLRVGFNGDIWNNVEWECLETDSRQLVALEHMELQISVDMFKTPKDVQELVNTRIEALELFKHGVLHILPWIKEVNIHANLPVYPI